MRMLFSRKNVKRGEKNGKKMPEAFLPLPKERLQAKGREWPLRADRGPLQAKKGRKATPSALFFSCRNEKRYASSASSRALR